MGANPNIGRKALTKTMCKRVIGAVQDMGIKDFDIVVEGSAIRIVIRDEPLNIDEDMGNLIDGMA